jgi:transposase-like protein
MRSGTGRGSVKLSKTLPKHLAVKRANVEIAISWLPNSTDAAGDADRQETGRWLNNGAENSHLPFRRRERAMLRIRLIQTLQKFVSVHASIQNHFNQERHLYSRINFKLNRAAAIAEWRQLLGA